MRGVSGEGGLGASVPPVWQMRRQLRQDALLPETSQQTRSEVELETGTRQVSRLFPSILLTGGSPSLQSYLATERAMVLTLFPSISLSLHPLLSRISLCVPE